MMIHFQQRQQGAEKMGEKMWEEGENDRKLNGGKGPKRSGRMEETDMYVLEGKSTDN